MTSLRTEYMLDPEVVFLNHGSFGACPKEVFAVYQGWQRELELNPVKFIGTRAPDLIRAAREKLGAYLHCAANDLVFTTNPSTAFNVAARSLELRPGDEILTSTYEYPTMETTMRYIAQRSGARIVHQPTTLPLVSAEEFVEQFWAGVTEKTRVIYLSHIAAFTAIILPVEEICRRARNAGIITIIDGAHAPSQIPLDLSAVGADCYVGACHKWLSAPKGSGFLYARPEAQEWLIPLVITGWMEQHPMPAREDGLSWFAALNQGQGTRDSSAFLSVPAAIEFQQARDWDHQRARCHELAAETRRRINQLTGEPALCPDSPLYFSQMASVFLPRTDIAALAKRLDEEFHIVAPTIPVLDRHCLRFSFQAYNDERDADILVGALEKILADLKA
jgi:isopenicillin-N epimerase